MFEFSEKIKSLANTTVWTFGAEKQKFKAIEELSELQRAICRNDKNNIIEEIGDALFLICQTMQIYNIEKTQIEGIFNAKINHIKTICELNSIVENSPQTKREEFLSEYWKMLPASRIVSFEDILKSNQNWLNIDLEIEKVRANMDFVAGIVEKENNHTTPF